MKISDVYRHEALRLCQKADAQPDFELRVEYESLAFAYMCLAEQTERDLLEWDDSGGYSEQKTLPVEQARH